MASWSLGRSVVCCDHPYFKEIIPSDSVAGRIIDSNPKEMSTAVRDFYLYR